jgi:chemotaxis protein MotB
MAEQNGSTKSGPSVIIKKVSKGGHGAHHGGAWKIAYADFVTAMMAFFLLLWLLNSVTQEQLEGISNYFAPTSISQTTSGSGDILGGKTVTSEGIAQSTTSRDSVTVDLPPPRAGSGGDGNETEQAASEPSEEAAEAKLRAREQEQFEDAKKELEETLAGIPQLKNLAESLLIDNTPEGLRIQLVDKEGLAMFPSGSAEMYLHTKRLLELVSQIIAKLPQNAAISGHTDASKFAGGDAYTNWELSADRANSARRELVNLGIPESRIQRVVGKAATEPLLPDDPKNPRNRRLSIVMLRGTGDDNPASGGTPDEPEALPGLNEIKRRQLDGEPAPAPPTETSPALELTPAGPETDAPPAAAPQPAPPSGGGIRLELQPRISQ